MKCVELFNVAYLKNKKGGYMLYRYPEKVISSLGYGSNKKGRDKAKIPAMCELLYHSKDAFFEITLEAYDHDADVFLFVNNLQIGKITCKKKKKETFIINVHDRLKEHLEDINKNQEYEFKLLFGSQSRMIVYDVEIKLIEKKNDLPFVLYGSSISQGAGCSEVLDSYAFLLSQRLDNDILNKGLSGSCLLEKKTVDYISSLNCKGFILEIGCNVRGVMEKEEFQKRFDYLIEEVAKKNPDKPIFIVSILDVFESLYKDFKEIPYHQKNIDFIRIIKRKIKKMNLDNIHLISAKSLITRIDGISNDLLHPSNLGHRMMSENIAKRMLKIIKED